MLVFHFNIEVVGAENFFGEVENVQKLLRRKSVAVVAGFPQLKRGNGFQPLGAAAINEMFGNAAYFGDVEMRRHLLAAGQPERDGACAGEMRFKGR